MSRQSNDLRETIETLKNVTILKSFADSPEELEKIARILSTENKKKGDIVIREGDTGEVLGLDHEIVPTVYPIVSRRRRRFFYREQLQNLFLP